MPVEFSCDGCNRRLRAPDAKAGKRTNCPTCGKELQIPVMSAGLQLSLPTAGAAPANPLDQLAAIIPSASEAAAAFNLSQPQSGPAPLAPVLLPPTPAPKQVSNPAPAQPIDIGLADEPTQKPAPYLSPSASNSGSTSSSGIGGSLKPKANAWRGGDNMPPTPGALPKPNAPRPAMPNSAPTSPQLELQIPAAPKSATPQPATPQPTTPKPTAPKPNVQLPSPAKPAMPNLVLPSAPKPAASAPASPLSLPMATAAPVSPLVPVAPVAPNPLDDIFKDLPQLAPVSAPSPQSFPSNGPMFGGLQPVTAADPFNTQGAALPTTVPNWSQVASTANVRGVNPYAAPSMNASVGYRGNANIESVRTIVLIPGIFLIISYSILLLLYAVQAVVTVVGGIALFSTNQVDEEKGGMVVFQMAVAVICFLLSIAGLFGAIKMVRLRSRSAALTAAIMAIFPFCICFPIGIWAVIVLSMENVRNAFEANDRRAERGM